MSKNPEKQGKPKIGAGHAQAMFRTGLDEIRSVILNEANVGTRGTEMGIYGTATPSEVVAQKNADAEKATPEKQDNVLNRHNYGPAPSAEREPPAIEPD